MYGTGLIMQSQNHTQASASKVSFHETNYLDIRTNENELVNPITLPWYVQKSDMKLGPWMTFTCF